MSNQPNDYMHVYEKKIRQTWMAVCVAQKTSVLEEVDGPWVHVVLHKESTEGLQVVLGRDEA